MKHQFFLLFVICDNDKIFKDEDFTEILKCLGLFDNIVLHTSNKDDRIKFKFKFQIKK